MIWQDIRYPLYCTKTCIIPMCFITIELRHSYGVTAIALWPVIAKDCDAVTHNYDKKIVTMRKYVIVFRNYRFQLKCKSSATASYDFVLLPPVDEQSSLTRTISLVLPYLLNIATHTHDTKSPSQSHLLRVHTSWDFEKNFLQNNFSFF